MFDYIFYSIILAVSIAVISVIFFTLSIYIKKFYDIIERHLLFKRFESCILAYETIRDVAFNYSFQQEAMVQFQSNQKLDKKELNMIRQKFIKKTIELCGPVLIKDLTEMRGNITSIVSELSIYFNIRMNKEELQFFTDRFDKTGEYPESDPSGYFMNKMTAPIEQKDIVYKSTL